MPCIRTEKSNKLPNFRQLNIWLIAAMLVGVISGCSQDRSLETIPSLFSAWKVADLRLLQAGEGEPGHRLIALYSRVTGFDLEIRLDFMDLAPSIDFDVYLALDTQPGGGTSLPVAAISGLDFDVLVKIPAVGAPQAFDTQNRPLAGLRPRSADHPGLDMMVVSLNQSALPGNPSEIGIQAFITAAGQPEILQRTLPVYPSGELIPTAPLVFVFWNALPAATPAQMLRRWDGAHTGPYGGRHGLNVLMQAVAIHKVPLVLADLKQPASLTALSLVGGLGQVRQSALRGDLILPESAVGDPLLADKSLADSRQAARLNGFNASSVAFGAFSNLLPPNYDFFLAEMPETSHILRWQSKRLIPLPGPVYPEASPGSDPQASLDGLTIATRRALLKAALSPDPGDLVVLGGSLPESAWGEFSIAPAAFAYIAAHPWMKPLDETGLARFPTTESVNWPLAANCQDLLCSPAVPQVFPVREPGIVAESSFSLATLRSILRGRLQQLKPGPFTDTAIQSYLSLSQPTESQSLAGLQANALGYVGYQIEAARWDESPYTRTECAVDMDFDGEKECLLATPGWFVILKTSGGRLVFAAQRTPSGAAQWVGSPAQFGVGLGDPSEWKPEIGPAGNPAEIPGAFALEEMPYQDFTPENQPGKITLRAAAGAVIKIFSFDHNDLKVELIFANPQSVRIPVTLDSQGWASGSSFNAWLPVPTLTQDRWEWKPDSRPGLAIIFKNAQAVTAKTSLDSIPWLVERENPNRTYPPGHYLAFPVAVIEALGVHFSMVFQSR